MHGPLHSKRESGVLYFKQLVQQQLKRHFDAEAQRGQEIWPAKRYQQLHTSVDTEEQFCAAVCGRGIKYGTMKDIEDL